MQSIYMVFHVFDMDDFDGVAISAEKPEAAAACGRMWWKRARRKRSPDPRSFRAPPVMPGCRLASGCSKIK